jgi:hypothetical protein
MTHPSSSKFSAGRKLSSKGRRALAKFGFTKKFDITRTNIAVERLIEVTENPRHRFLLLAYNRHRYLEMAGRYKEIFAPDMMVEHPVYHFHALGISTKLDGRGAVMELYRQWAETDQCIFYAEDEQVAVADNFVASILTGYQQTLGKTLIAYGIDADDENAMYLYKAREEMIWPYDDCGRLIGEDVWEPDPSEAEIIKLDPADVLTVEEAARLLTPLIKPLPVYDGMVLGKIPA